MTCQRCQGLMVADHCIDMEEGGRYLWLSAWRCMNCGDIVDPEIIRHRQLQLTGLVERTSRTSGSKHEVILIGG
jgi:hypothetical protein